MKIAKHKTRFGRLRSSQLINCRSSHFPDRLFGGVTAFVRSPALGLWKEDSDEVNSDEVVMFEVLAAQLDRQWWANYRKHLQNKFRQEELLVWASNITKL
jgi:hypothetical protein